MRKRPKQERSQLMVATLIEATARAMSKYGFDGVTTPKIAEIAGVSVGSLYQYFDDKQGLIEALLKQKAHELLKALQVQFMTLQPENAYDAVRQTLTYTFNQLQEEDGLYLEIVKNWNRLPMEKMIDIVQSSSMDFWKMFLLRHYQDFPSINLHVKFFIIINSTIFTLMRFASSDNHMLQQEELVDCLTNMIIDTLQQDGNPHALHGKTTPPLPPATASEPT
jgi:AcrR family transcriptional regulator